MLTSQRIDLGNGLSFSMQGTTLLMTLASGRGWRIRHRLPFASPGALAKLHS
jgi:hypothetical protein